MIPHEIPFRSWKVVRSDLFHMTGEVYLLIADHSKFWFIHKTHKSRDHKCSEVNIWRTEYNRRYCKWKWNSVWQLYIQIILQRLGIRLHHLLTMEPIERTIQTVNRWWKKSKIARNIWTRHMDSNRLQTIKSSEASIQKNNQKNPSCEDPKHTTRKYKVREGLHAHTPERAR